MKADEWDAAVKTWWLERNPGELVSHEIGAAMADYAKEVADYTAWEDELSALQEASRAARQAMEMHFTKEGDAGKGLVKARARLLELVAKVKR